MDISPPLTYSRCLYGLGLDVNYGPPGSNSKSLTPNPSPPLKLWCHPVENSAQASRQPSIHFDVANQQHRTASCRVGESFAVWPSIGTSSGGRRKSAEKEMKRVKTIDNIPKGEHARTWAQPRPLSVCPSLNPLQPPTPSERGSPPKTPNESGLEQEVEDLVMGARKD
ncbi:hypothetical protein BKA65DRAFT_471433 [Rhexocercosporidium sp. MPI-PUGE-AT-0058]|nr:hypothetical protein BKA65DRAFT_471433 [Rhexocercosporidium sp. MPI-PUGE-AT-0058]